VPAIGSASSSTPGETAFIGRAVTCRLKLMNTSSAATSTVLLTKRTLAWTRAGGKLGSLYSVALSAPAGPVMAIAVSVADGNVTGKVSSAAPGVAVDSTFSSRDPAAIVW